jgi:tetratricopeptide (TPR) repeat protein
MSPFRTFKGLCAATTLLLVLTYACHRFYQDNSDERSEEQMQLYSALNDSLQHLTPNAVRLAEEQMRLAKDSLTWYDFYMLRGRHYLLTDKPDSALPYAVRTLRFVERQPTQTPRTRGLASQALVAQAGYHYLLHHNSDSIIALYMKAYRLMMESDLKVGLPDLSANIGDAYVAMGDMPEGSRWYRRALFLVDSLGMPTKESLTLYMGLGRIYTSIGEFQQAKNYYEMADQQYEQMKPNMQSYFLNNYGNYFYYKREYPEALQMFRRMKKHLERYHAENNFDMFLCKVNMADVFLNLHEADSARAYVDEAEAYFRRMGVGVGIYYAHTIRIGIALLEKNYSEVPRILMEEQGMAAPDDPDMKGIRSKYMDNYYAAIGNYRQAYAILQDNVERRDSSEIDRKNMRTQDIMLRLTEDTIRLHHQVAMNEEKAAHTRTQLISGITVASLIILALIAVIYTNYLRKQRLKAELSIMHLRLNNARQRISPHFVFNVLNSRISESSQQEADQLMMMARLIRANLDLTTKTYVTLAEELDFVRQYVAVEHDLMGTDFDFSIEAPETSVLEQQKMPSMLVQILVENAIIHGLKDKEGDKRLTIRVDSDDEQTIITVADNGPGFDIRQYNSDRSRTGLSIIRNTLAVINQNNSKARIKFSIHNDNGCQATLTIPKNIKLL